MVKLTLTVPKLSATSLAHPKNTSEITQSGGRPSLSMMPEIRRRAGDSRLRDAVKRLTTCLRGRFSVVSVLGGRPWSVLQNGSSAKWMVLLFGEVVMVDWRDWMLRGVQAMVMVKFVLCWICFASARNGMRWP